MVLVQCDKFSLYLFQDIDFKGDKVYSVKYGLELHNDLGIHEARKIFNVCLSHAIDCEGVMS